MIVNESINGLHVMSTLCGGEQLTVESSVIGPQVDTILNIIWWNKLCGYALIIKRPSKVKQTPTNGHFVDDLSLWEEHCSGF